MVEVGLVITSREKFLHDIERPASLKKQISFKLSMWLEIFNVNFSQQTRHDICVKKSKLSNFLEYSEWAKMHVKLHSVEKIIKMSEAEDYNSSELDDKLLDENTVTTVDQVLKV